MPEVMKREVGGLCLICSNLLTIGAKEKVTLCGAGLFSVGSNEADLHGLLLRSRSLWPGRFRTVGKQYVCFKCLKLDGTCPMCGDALNSEHYEVLAIGEDWMSSNTLPVSYSLTDGTRLDKKEEFDFFVLCSEECVSKYRSES